MTQTYGQKAVGSVNNPSAARKMQEVRECYATLIDELNIMRDLSKSGEQKRLFSVAITETQAACMWAVKAITWKEED